MKKVKALVCACALTLSFSVSAFAGVIPIGGFCDSQQCTQENAPDGGVWVQIAEFVWEVMPNI